MTDQASDEELQAKRCTICEQRFTSDAMFCPFCGEPLVEAPGVHPKGDPLIDALVDGRYEVLSMIGEGGMGTVYRVRHRVLQRMFAMKVLRREVAREKELGTRFIQEARTAATISHPNVVQINDYGQLPDGAPYFVMEMLEGTPLSRMIRNGGPLPAARAVRIVEQIASGLGAAHRAGVIHRDLKPDNVFVLESEGARDRVKILDFGVAKVAGNASITRTGMVFGSPHYMSPEQASGQPVDHRTDIYAIGVIMYELFTGRVPFEADTFMGVLTKHMFMSPEPFMVRIGDAAKELGALQDITLRCLEKKPENRFPTMDALAAAIEEIVELGAGDEIDVRPSRGGIEPRPAASSFRLADELEPPLSIEIKAARARRDSQERQTRLAVVALVVAGCMLVIALAVLAWVRIPQQSASGAAPGSSSVQIVASATTVASVPAPLPAFSAPPAQPTAAVGPEAGASTAKAEAAPIKPPPPRSTGAAPTATAKPPKPRPASGGTEIVNPWSE